MDTIHSGLSLGGNVVGGSCHHGWDNWINGRLDITLVNKRMWFTPSSIFSLMSVGGNQLFKIGVNKYQYFGWVGVCA